jgi:threonine/homoserine/homoserine lactone efflux protein
MLESIITVLIIGFLAGFIFSMPVAGPISIIITSNALKGNQRFCTRTAIGASVVEFFYVFIVIYGITKLYGYYKNYVPYILLIGSVFLFFIAYQIIKTNLNFDEFNLSKKVDKKIENKGGLRAGLILNLTNPTLLFGWLTSSFLVFSLASSLSLNTGGLDLLINENVNLLSNSEQSEIVNSVSEKSISDFLLSIIYAFSVAFGGFIWLVYFSKFIIKHRKRLNISSVNKIIKILGYCLIGIAFYLVWKAIVILLC